MSIMVAMGKAAQVGVLFRDAEAIEHMRRIDTLIVDKTGTLTDGRPAFKEVVAFEGFDADQVLHLAASLDQGSEHPLADAIVAEARRRNFEFDRVEDFDSVTGMGVRGSVARSEEHTSELQSLMRTSYAVFCLKKKTLIKRHKCTAHEHINDGEVRTRQTSTTQ